MKSVIHSDQAPAAIGTYSQAVKSGTTVYLSGQIPLHPESMTLVSEDFTEQVHQVFRNLAAVCEAAQGNLDHMVKVNIYLTNLSNFATVNEVMSQYFNQPYPARAAIGVSQLPKDAQIEIDGILQLPE